MALTITLKPDTLKALHEVNPMLASYNVEFAEVTGVLFGKLIHRNRLPVQNHSM